LQVNGNDTLSQEVQSRLDALFEEKRENNSNCELDDTPMQDLRAAVLSIEWEISEATLVPFLDKLNQMADACKKDPVSLYFIKILIFLGKYIRAQKSNCDPEAIRELNNAFEDFEEVMPAHQHSDAERKEILLKTFQRFKNLKKRLFSLKAGEPKHKKNVEVEKTDDCIGTLFTAIEKAEFVTQSQLREAVDEIKDFISSELEALRKFLHEPS
jgi:hypothetical protein